MKFTDRNVIDAPDGYVACESYKDSHSWEHMANMERAMQVKYFLYIGAVHKRCYTILDFDPP